MEEVHDIFQSAYMNKTAPIHITEAHYVQQGGIHAVVTVQAGGMTQEFTAKGNGRLDAVSNAIRKGTGMDFTVITYTEHALETGSTSQAVAYVGLQWASGAVTWGAGTDSDIMTASVKALASAINNKH